jgi:hypothetical protein
MSGPNLLRAFYTGGGQPLFSAPAEIPGVSLELPAGVWRISGWAVGSFDNVTSPVQDVELRIRRSGGGSVLPGGRIVARIPAVTNYSGLHGVFFWETIFAAVGGETIIVDGLLKGVNVMDEYLITQASLTAMEVTPL